MNYERACKLLSSLDDPKVISELASEVQNLNNSGALDLFRAVTDHMIKQHLRAAKDGLEGYGRVQGMNALLDFFKWVTDYSESLLKEREAQSPEQPAETGERKLSGGYGLA